MSPNWELPAPGDIVWCLFPEVPDIEPGPKPRPALVMSVEQREHGNLISVVYGTSKHLSRLSTGEVAITQAKHPRHVDWPNYPRYTLTKTGTLSAFVLSLKGSTSQVLECNRQKGDLNDRSSNKRRGHGRKLAHS